MSTEVSELKADFEKLKADIVAKEQAAASALSTKVKALAKTVAPHLPTYALGGLAVLKLFGKL
jgi:hypothetical protein